jgi:hypothetical protein
MVCLARMNPLYMMLSKTAKLAKAFAIFVSRKQAPIHMDMLTAEAFAKIKMMMNNGKCKIASVVEESPIMKYDRENMHVGTIRIGMMSKSTTEVKYAKVLYAPLALSLRNSNLFSFHTGTELKLARPR